MSAASFEYIAWTLQFAMNAGTNVLLDVDDPLPLSPTLPARVTRPANINVALLRNVQETRL